MEKNHKTSKKQISNILFAVSIVAFVATIVIGLTNLSQGDDVTLSPSERIDVDRILEEVSQQIEVAGFTPESLERAEVIYNSAIVAAQEQGNDRALFRLTLVRSQFFMASTQTNRAMEELRSLRDRASNDDERVRVDIAIFDIYYHLWGDEEAGILWLAQMEREFAGANFNNEEYREEFEALKYTFLGANRSEG